MSINSSGNVTANVDFRAPIFYDSDNTAFFINGASNSNLNTLQTYSYQGNSNVAGTGNASYHPSGIYSTGTNWLYGTMYLNGNSINDVSYIGMIGANTTPINITGASHKYLTINPGNGYEAMVRYIGGTGSSWYVGKRTATQLVGPESFHFYSEAAGQTVSGIDTSGNLFSIGSMRTPIFYDQDNTAFFLNPNTTATSLRIAGGIKQNNLVGRPYAVWGSTGTSGAVVIKFPGNTGNYGMIHAVIDIYEYNGNNACTVIVGGHNWNSNWYNFGATLVGYTDKPVRVGVKDGKYCIVIGNGSSSWSYGQVVLRKIQNGTYYDGVMDVAEGYTAAIESDTYSYISGDLRGFRSTTVTATSAMYSPVYYDSDDTQYKFDGTGGSVFGYGRFNSATSGYSLLIGPNQTTINGVTHVLNDDARYSLQVNAPYYPHIGIGSTSNSGNTTHGPVLSFQGWKTAGGYRRFVMGIANTNPDELSFGWQDNFDNPHYGVGINWSYPASIWYNTNHDFYVRNNVYAYRFYDRDNTGYYADPAGTNNFNQTEQNGRMWFSNYLVSRNEGGMMGSYNSTGTASKVIWTIGESWPIGNMYGLGYEYASSTFLPGDPHVVALRNNGSTYTRLQMNGGIYTTGAIYSTAALYSPIYYDSDNTGYYVNAAGTSNLTYLVVANGNSVQHNAYNNNGSFMMNNSGQYWGMMSNVGSQDWRLGYGGGNSIVGWNLRWDNGSTAWAQSFQANIMYDAQNTAYYVDPNSSSELYGTLRVQGGHGDSRIRLRLLGSNNGDGSGDVNLMMWCSEPGNTWSGAGFGYNVDNNLNANTNVYYWGRPNTNHGQAYMRFDTSGNMYFYNTSTGGARVTNMELYPNNTVYFNNYASGGNSLRAPIFYDSNDTAYYSDQNSTSQYYRVSVNEYLYARNGNGRIYLNGNLHIDSFSGNSIYMNYYSNLPIRNYGHNYYNGYDHYDVSTGYANGSYRAPIFYDNNNTGYYFNGDGTTNMYAITDYTRRGAFNLGRMLTTRRDIVGDQNYWTGTWGWGTSYGNWDTAWESGFGAWDIWGGGTGHPQGGGYVHAQGIVAGQHYTTAGGGAAYGWMMVGAGDATPNRYWARGKWGGGVSGWKEFAMYGGGGSGDLRANVFYDSDDTGYYADFNTTSQQAIRVRGGMFMGPNPTWGAYLRVGSDNRPDGYASVTVTNGNLHLDCQNGYETYINHYNGSRTYLYEVRTNFIYDRDDTSYYLDPNGTSSLSRFTNRTHAALNRGNHWITPRFDYTGDTNYWTGTFGWGTSAGNWDNAWKAGFSGWDIWGGGTGHPQGGGYIHAQGIVSGLHYATSDGGAAYGWMMVGAGDATANRYWARGKWGGGTSGWLEFVMSGSNPGYTLYSYIMYDANNTGYYCDPNGYSQFSSGEFNNYCRVARIDFIGTGGNSGQGTNAYNIFQEGGGWGYPYPDLRIAYHTGIKLGGNAGSYEGTRVYSDYDMSDLCIQLAGSSNYSFKYKWMYTNDTGFYSGTNGAHWYPNDWTYGAWRMNGNRNGWYGHVIDSSYRPHYMWESGNGGCYLQDAGRWVFYHSLGNNCTGHGTSSTSSSYRIYVGGSIYAEGNIVAYSDRRAKENITSVDNALDKVLKMRGVFYNTIKDETKKRQIGVIAQEIEEILPEVVTYASDVDEYGVSYGNFAGLFIEAIKEQSEVIKKQSEEIKELKEILNNLIFNNKE